MSILKDITTAVKLTAEVRKARKSGADSIQINPVYKVPGVAAGPVYYNTIEGCLSWEMGEEADKSVMKLFKSLPYETQMWLSFTPEGPWEWAERARFWQRELKPVLPPKMHHSVMARFVSWYAHCKRRRNKA